MVQTENPERNITHHSECYRIIISNRNEIRPLNTWTHTKQTPAKQSLCCQTQITKMEQYKPNHIMNYTPQQNTCCNASDTSVARRRSLVLNGQNAQPKQNFTPTSLAAGKRKTSFQPLIPRRSVFIQKCPEEGKNHVVHGEWCGSIHPLPHTFSWRNA
jgi:hypothetical protein